MKTLKLQIIYISIFLFNVNFSYGVDYVTRANGNWNNPATWRDGLVPPSSLNNDRIFIMTGHLVTMNDAIIFGNSCRLLIYSSAVLTVNNNFR